MENKPAPDEMIEATNDRNIANSPKDHIIAWGIDANPNNNPTYPMKEWNGADHQRFNYPKPEQQPIDREVLYSIERPGISRVFGTSVPPSGLSGMIRRLAFKASESTYLHWFPLVVADRINVYEGLLHDFSRGIFPNFIKERGWDAEWKYNRKGMIKTMAVGAAVATVAILLISKKKKANKAKHHSKTGNQLGVNTI